MMRRTRAEAKEMDAKAIRDASERWGTSSTEGRRRVIVARAFAIRVPYVKGNGI